MGSGKSSAGKKIASLMHWKFADTDSLAEVKEGMAVHEIFTGRGEEYFRRIETEVLREVSGKTRTVVACGGGTPCNAENLSMMKSTGLAVYLRMTPEALRSRLMHSRNERPLLKGAEPAELTSRINDLLSSRTTWYDQADLIIDAENHDEKEMTALIAEALRSKGSHL